MKTYTAITIGPIYKTMLKARSAKAFWSGSYLFSYMMKYIYQEVKKAVGKENIILPTYQETEENLQVGIFPDRILVEGTLDNFDTIKSTLIDDLASKISFDLKAESSVIKPYLEQYLVINKVEADVNANESAVAILNGLLDTSELFQKTNAHSEQDYLADFFELKNRGYNTFIKEEFGGQPVKSIPEIIEHSEKSNYIAIVQADGDNFGKFITSLSKSEVQTVSGYLFNFSKKAVQTIKQYGGVPIFAGGDDLMFFAPVIMGMQTIIDLTEQIDADFTAAVLNNIQGMLNGQKAPTLSYGINISYHKYPLNQALNNSGELLFGQAKQGDKNAIALRVTKHSGQVFETIFHKGGNLFEDTKTLIKNLKLKDDFISGFMYKLSPLKDVIKGIGLSNDIENRFAAFFENYYDEDVHKGSDFLKQVQAILVKIYTEHPLNGLSSVATKDDTLSPLDAQNERNINLLYSVLRFHQFINAKTDS